MENSYKVYVKADAAGYVTAVNSDEFLSDFTGWIQIDEGFGGKYHHAQSRYFPNPIRTDNGAYRYKLVDGKAVECSAEEIVEQEAQNNTPSNIPTLEDRVSILENKVDVKISEYEESLQELGVEL